MIKFNRILTATAVATAIAVTPAHAFGFFGLFSKDKVETFRKQAPADTIFYFESQADVDEMVEYPESLKDMTQVETVLDQFASESGLIYSSEYDIIRSAFLTYITAAYEGPKALQAEYGLPKTIENAIYMDGMFPVFQIALAKNNDALLTKVMQTSEELDFEPAIETIQGHEVYVWNIKQNYEFDVAVQLGLVINNDIATFALLHDDLTDERKAQVLGLVDAATSVASEKIIKNMKDSYYFEKNSLGYFSLVELGNAVLDIQNSTAGKDFLALVGEDALEGYEMVFPQACRNEGRALISSVPRIVLGYTDYDVNGSNVKGDFQITTELAHPEILADLLSLNGHLSKYTAFAEDKFIAYALGVNGNKLSTVLGSLWSRATDASFECEYLTEFQYELANSDAQQALMATATINGVHGAGAALYDFDFNGDIEEMSVDMLATVTAENPMALINLLKMAAPLEGIADIEEGKTVSVSLPGMDNIDLKVSVVGNHIGVFTGEKSAAAFVKESAEPINSDGLLQAAVNYSKLNEVMELVDQVNSMNSYDYSDVNSCIEDRMGAKVLDQPFAGLSGEFVLKEAFSKHGLDFTGSVDITLEDIEKAEAEAAAVKVPSDFSPVGNYTVETMTDDCTWDYFGEEHIRDDQTGSYDIQFEDDECAYDQYAYNWSIDGTYMTYLDTAVNVRSTCSDAWEADESADPNDFEEYGCEVISADSNGFECLFDFDGSKELYRYNRQ